MLPLNTNYYNHVAVSDFSSFYFFISFTYITHAVVFTCYGHCHHLSVECLALAPTGKSYPPLRQEMQDAFRPEQDRGEALHTFFLNDQKESVQRKSRRHRFIGQFFLYTDSVNLNTLLPPSFSAVWLFHHHFLC